MDHDALAHHLNHLLSLESRSLLQHLREAKPYLTSETFRIWRDLLHLADQSSDHANQLTSLLNRINAPVYVGVFDTNVGFYHFTDLGTILPQLLVEKQHQIEGYEAALVAAEQMDDVREALQVLLDHKRAQVDEIRRANDKLVAA